MITAEMRSILRQRLKDIMIRDNLIRSEVAQGMDVLHMTVTAILDGEMDKQWSKKTFKKLQIYLKKKREKQSMDPEDFIVE